MSPGIEEVIGAAIVTAIASSAVASTVIIGTVTVGQVVGAAVIGAALIGLELVLAPDVPTPDQQHQSIRQPITARTAGYGYTRQGGVYLFYEALNGNSYDILAICVGPIQFVRTYFLDEDVVTLGFGGTGGFNWVEGTPNIDDDRYLNQIQITVNMGLATETAFPNTVAAFPSVWDVTHRGDTLCTVELICHGVKQSDVHLFYPALLPHVSLVIDHPAIWDFRDVGQDPTNPATWIAYSVWAGTTLPIAVTITIATPGVLTDGNAAPVNGTPCVLATTGALPTGFTAGVTYYVVNSSGVLFELAATLGGLPINTTGTQSGIQSAVFGAASTYAAGARVLYNGVVYYSIAGGNINNNPETSVGKWVSVFGNPVLQLVDYITNTTKGLGLDRDTVVTASIPDLIVEANICDEMIEKANLDNEPLYTSNISFQLDNDPAQVMGNIASTCDMWIAENGDGTLALKVGKYRSPTVFLTASHVISIDCDFGQTDEQVVNHIELSFTSPTQNYKLVPAQPWENTADIDLRGVTRSNNLALAAVYSPSQARRLAKRAFTRLNSPIRGTIVTTLYGITALGERWIGVDYPEYPGLAGAVVEVQRVAPDWNTGTVAIDFLQIDPSTIDSWDAATEEGTVPVNPNFVSNGTLLPVPQNVVATYLGVVATGIAIQITFDDPGQSRLTYIMQYRLVDDGSGNPGPWVTQLVQEVSTNLSTITLNTVVLQGNESYVIEIASVGATGTFSDWSNPQYVLTADNTLVTDDGITIITDDNIPFLGS